MKQKKSETAAPKKKHFPRWLTGLIVYAISIAVVLTVIIGGFSVAYAGQIFPRVTVGDINIGGMKPDQAKEKLKEGLKDRKIQPVILTDSDNHSFTIKPEDVAVTFDIDKSIDAAMAIGRGKDWLSNISQEVTTPLLGLDLPAKVTLDQNKLTDALKTITDKVNVPEENADLIIKNGSVSIKPSKIGQSVDSDQLKQQVLDTFGRNEPDTINMKISKKEPLIKEDGAEKIKTDAETMLSGPIILTYKDQTYTASPAIIGGWLETKITKALLGNKLELNLNEQRISDYLDTIGAKINQDPVNARISVTNGQINILEASKDGQRLKEDAAKADIIRLLGIRHELPPEATTPSSSTSPAVSPSVDASTTPELATNQIALEVEVTKPDVTNDNISQIGIKERIAIATTDFKGSPQNRQTNITLGTKLFNGIILKPGEQFSAIKSLGRIDESAGFKPELVIKEDQLTPEVGGGLCQVSTTLFRSVLNAGLQIDERRNHKERVGYYESRPSNPDPEDYVSINAKTLVGMDATIYDPSPDFKFTNDTDHYMLIQGHVEGTRLTFELFGTKDGRKTSVDGPYILSTTPAPTDIAYIDDPTLPTGTTKLKETAHPGAKTSFTYVVTKDGKQIHKNTFTSTYVPWQGKYYRGTGPAPAPSPSPTPVPMVDPNATPTPGATPTGI